MKDKTDPKGQDRAVGDEKLVERFTNKEAETIHQAIIAYSPHPKVIDNIAKKLEVLSDGWRR